MYPKCKSCGKPKFRGHKCIDWQAPTSRDYPAEWHEENGSYFNKCCECNKQFIGRKRRIVCRDCLDINKDKQIKELEAELSKAKQEGNDIENKRQRLFHQVDILANKLATVMATADAGSPYVRPQYWKDWRGTEAKAKEVE